MSGDIQSCVLKSACEISSSSPYGPNGLTIREQQLLDFQLSLKNGTIKPGVQTLTEAVNDGIVDYNLYLNITCAPGYTGALCVRWDDAIWGGW